MEQEQQSLADLLREFGESSRELLRQEARLARAETNEAYHRMQRATVWLAMAAAPALMALVAAPLTVIWALGLVLPLWAAALITFGFFASVAGVFALLARAKLKRAEPVPHETIRSLKEDARWVRDRMS